MARRLLSLYVVALLLSAVLPAHAWFSAVQAEPSLPSPKPTTDAPVMSGMQAVNISVGCGSTITYPTDAALDPTQPRFTYIVESPAAEFISLHFAQFNLPPDDYIVVRPTDNSDKPKAQYFGRTHRHRFFSRAIYTQSVTLEFYSANGSTDADVGFRVDQFRYLAAPAAFEKSTPETVCGADESDEAPCFQAYPEAFERSRAVARLLIHKAKKSYFCTGWLVGCEGHLITNHHCISTQEHAENSEFEFLAQGKTCETKCAKPFGCRGRTRATTAKLIVANAALDYALVLIDGNLTKDYGYLQLRETGAKLQERIYIPQHPAGWGKRIAMKDGEQWGRVTSLTRGGCIPNQVAYGLDTQGGASGSPVLAWHDNAVVALHHCGGNCVNTAVNARQLVADMRAKDVLPECAVYADDGNGDGDS